MCVLRKETIYQILEMIMIRMQDSIQIAWICMKFLPGVSQTKGLLNKY